MPSPFHGIDTTSRALRAFQRALETTGHNIANVNTPGYTRQAVDLVTSYPLQFHQFGEKSLGTGVLVGSINRMRDGFLESRIQSANSDLAQADTMATSVKDILSVMQEPGDQGISAALTKFFDSWSALSSNPNESANRLQVQLAGKDLAGKVRQAWGDLNNQKAQKGDEIAGAVEDINNLAQQISSLNDAIRDQMASGGMPNDLLDQRDYAVKQLSGLANITVVNNQDNTVSVQISEFTLTDQLGAHALPATFDPVAGKMTGWIVPITVRSGRLAGLLQANQQIESSMANLDTLANTLRTQINLLHTSGTNLNATTNIKFFNDVASGPQTGAIDFNLSTEVSTDYKNISSGTSGAAGDGALALSLSNARNSKFAALGNKSVLDYHRDMVSTLGSTAAYYESNTGTQSAILDQVSAQQQAVSGVNLDDEMANMLRYQRSYQAAAKALTVFDQVTETLIGMLQR
ncbi:MAG: flagellar hook-associated protein FlgK [Armatimonadetes bacterium]|nr:flagellar hook-associated protein FlgK [Armatimonadota bacterium]